MTICNNEIFKKEKLWGEEGVLGVKGKWRDEWVQILNVYAPCVDAKREELWSQIERRIKENVDGKWCVYGKFNTIRYGEERRGRQSKGDRTRMRAFNAFIANANLIDLPLIWRKFT